MKENLTEQAEFEWNEPEAIKRAQSGDAAAFEYLYKSHSKRVYGICMRMLKNATDAEDLTQHVFLRLFRKIGSFRGEAKLSTWLHRVTVNAVLMHLRRKKPTEAYIEGWDETTGTNGHAPIHVDAGKSSMLGIIDRVNLMRAIRHLPAGLQEIVFAAPRDGLQAQRDSQTCGLFHWLFQIAGAQGSQETTSNAAWRDARTRTCHLCLG
jgi:RNA polymerase sigma-70 factor, ECF subfamily